MCTPKEALFWPDNGHFFAIFKSLCLKKTSKYSHIEVVEKASFTKKNVLWKLRRTFSGSFWETD